jgi:hypothetical protein
MAKARYLFVVTRFAVLLVDYLSNKVEELMKVVHFHHEL